MNKKLMKAIRAVDAAWQKAGKWPDTEKEMIEIEQAIMCLVALADATAKDDKTKLDTLSKTVDTLIDNQKKLADKVSMLTAQLLLKATDGTRS